MLQEMIVEGWAPPRRRVRIGKPRLLWIVARCSVFGDDAAGHRRRASMSSAPDWPDCRRPWPWRAAACLSCSRMPPGRPAAAAAPTMTACSTWRSTTAITSSCPATMPSSRYLRAIGAEDRVAGPARAEFPFFDLATGRRWTLRPNDGPIPWWALAAGRRVPGTHLGDYLALATLMRRHPGRRIDEVAAVPWLAVGKIPAARAGVGPQHGAGGRLGRSCRRRRCARRSPRAAAGSVPASPCRAWPPLSSIRPCSGLCQCRRGDPVSVAGCVPCKLDGRQGDRLDLRRWRGDAGAAGSRDPRGAALDGPGTAARARRSRRVPRHRQRAFQHRPARRQRRPWSA